MCRDDLVGGPGFITEFWGSIVRIAGAELRDKHCAAPDVHAEDVAAAVRMILLNKWDEIREPENYTYVITARQARTHARKCRRESPAEIGEWDVPLFSEPGLDPEQKAELAEYIEWALSQVAGEEADIIVKRYYLDMAFASIAEQLRKPLGTITSAHTRALAKIRKAETARQAASPAAPDYRTLEHLRRRPS